MNLSDLFAIPLRRTPGKLALRFRDGDVTADLTYEEVSAAAGRLADHFHSLGLKKGDRVAFFLGNRPEFVIAYLALLRLGAVLVPINLAYRRREIAHILEDAAPRLLLTERAQLAFLEELEAGERGSVEGVLLAEELDPSPPDPLSHPLPTTGRGGREEAGRVGAPLSRMGGGDGRGDGGEGPLHGSDLAMILYTSGTTGRSKGAMISHDNVLATMTGLLAAWDWQPDDTLLLSLPLFHTHGLVVGLHCALAAGATVLLRRRFDAAETVRDLLSGEPTLFFGVPTMYVRLVDELRTVDDRAALDRMRLFCSGSAPLAPETFTAFRDLTGHAILERYGMTETGMNLSNPYAGERVPGTVGTPLPGVSIRIVDTADAGGSSEVEPGGEGELLVRGSNVFSGYWQAPEKTAESFVHDAADAAGWRWFRTGDLARQDPATGSITLLGRRHELIISGGFNVYPREVEEVLVTFPGIREAAVVGRRHPEWGEVPAAFLVTEREIDEAELITFCKSQMAAFKVPREIRFVEALPRNALGKVQKHLL